MNSSSRKTGSSAQMAGSIRGSFSWINSHGVLCSLPLFLLATLNHRLYAPALAMKSERDREALDLVELVLDKPVRRLHVRLPGVGARRAARMA